MFALHPRLRPFPVEMLGAPRVRYVGEMYAALRRDPPTGTLPQPILVEAYHVAMELCVRVSSRRAVRHSPVALALYIASQIN